MEKYIQILYIFMCVLLLSFRVQANECPGTYPGDWVVNSNTYYNQNNSDVGIYIFGVREGSYIRPFSYYLGQTNSKYFISKTDIYGCHRWIKMFTDIPNSNSLMNTGYSSGTNNVYYTLKSSSNFTLIQINPENGNFERSYRIYTVYQDSNQICNCNRERPLLYCLGKQISNGGLAIIRFDELSLDMYLAYYPSTYLSDQNCDLVIIFNNRMFFYAREDTLNHLIDASFKNDSQNFTEHSHYTVNCNSSINLIKALEYNEIIFHVMECQNNLIYFSRSLGSRIGNIYSIRNIQNFDTLSLFLFYYRYTFLYILLQDNTSYSILKFATENLGSIMMYQKEINTSNFNIKFFKSIHSRQINIVESMYNVSEYHAVHTQINFQLFDKFYQATNMNEASNFTFVLTYGSQYDLYDNITSSYISAIQNHTEEYQFTETSADTIQKIANQSYAYKLYDSSYTFERNFLGTVVVFGSVPSFSISDLSCPLENYSNTTFSYDISYQGKSCSSNESFYDILDVEIVSPPVNCQMNLKISNVLSNCDYRFTLRTNYSGENYYNRYSVETSYLPPPVNIELLGFKISPMNLKIALGISTGISFSGKMLFGSSDRNEWTLIHVSQQILMLPLIAFYIKEQVQEYIVSNAFSALSVYILEEGWIESIPVINKLNFNTTSYFRMCNWPSGSTIVNNTTVILVILMIMMI